MATREWSDPALVTKWGYSSEIVGTVEGFAAFPDWLRSDGRRMNAASVHYTYHIISRPSDAVATDNGRMRHSDGQCYALIRRTKGMHAN